MAAVAEDQRLAELRGLGASEPLVRLSAGDCLHGLFRDSCLGPPYYVYHGAGTPEGPPLVPLWDHGDTAVAAWGRTDGTEFIEFSVEAAGRYAAVARTEQGFWATRFDFLYEADAALAELREAARAVGFQFLELLLAAREAAGGRLGAFEGHGAWLRELVAGIDRESGNRA